MFFGLGFVLPRNVVKIEDKIRNGLGLTEDNADVGIGF